MITQPFQKSVYDSVTAALPFAVDPAKITVEPGVSYSPSPIKIHDYAVGVMAAFGSVVDHIGTVRGMPAQTVTLNRRHCGLALNSGQLHFLNGYGTLMDTWPIGPDNGTYRTAEKAVGAQKALLNELMSGPFSSLLRNFSFHSGSARKAGHFCSRSAIDSQASK